MNMNPDAKQSTMGHFIIQDGQIYTRVQFAQLEKKKFEHVNQSEKKEHKRYEC